jgi:hypothetical protein
MKMMQNQKLELLFSKTSQQPELFSEFLNQLLISDVFCIGDDSDQSNVYFQMLETPEGEQAIPFFLSLDTLRSSFGDDLDYFIMSARDFFEMTKGAVLLLNPASDYMKEFAPDEIEFLLSLGLS